MPNHIGITHRGLVRSENEDCFGIFEIGNAAYLYVVCDGIGGSAGGREASSLTLSAFSEFIHTQLSHITQKGWSSLSLAQIKRIMRAAATDASKRVHALSLTDEALTGMGSTLVAALITPNRIYVINVGDSRLYTVSEQGIEKITRDHSYIQYLLDVGRISPDQVKNMKIQNFITQAIGAYDHADGDFCALDLASFELPTYLLLCSDGLYSTVSESKIQDILMKNQNISEKASALIDAALFGGGQDNITALVAEV